MEKKLLPPLLFLICITAMVLFTILFPELAIIPTPWNYIGFPFLIVGLGIVMNIQRLFKNEGTEINTFRKPKKLVIKGLFQYSRNPIYLGFTIALIGVVILLGSLAALDGLLAFILLANYWYIPFEEKAMEEAFGQAYIDYKTSVGRWF